MSRQTISKITIGYFAGLLLLAVALFTVSPGPAEQEILGVFIATGYEHEKHTFISGRSFQCSPARWDSAPESTCSLTIAGKELLIQASQNPLSNPIQLGGKCSATYAGESQPCNIVPITVSVHFAARIFMPELTSLQQMLLRLRYILHNLPESFYFYGLFVFPAIGAALTALTVSMVSGYTTRSAPVLILSSLSSGIVIGVLIFVFWLTMVFGIAAVD